MLVVLVRHARLVALAVVFADPDAHGALGVALHEEPVTQALMSNRQLRSWSHSFAGQWSLSWSQSHTVGSASMGADAWIVYRRSSRSRAASRRKVL